MIFIVWKTNNKETTDKPKSYTTPTSSQTSSLSQVYHQPNKNHKLIPSGKNYSKQIISDESSANQNKSTKNDQKIPKKIRLTHPKKRNEEYQNSKTIYTIKYRHNPNKQIWHPVYSIIKAYGHITKSKINSTYTPGK